MSASSNKGMDSKQTTTYRLAPEDSHELEPGRRPVELLRVGPLPPGLCGW